MIEIKQSILNDKPIVYTSKTMFLVQVGRYSGSYKTRYSFEGDLAKAVTYFNCINIGRGYKKRLIAPTLNNPLLARTFS